MRRCTTRLLMSAALASLVGIVPTLTISSALGSQVTLTADDDLTQGAPLGTTGTLPPDITPSSGDGSRANPWVYSFNPAHTPPPGGLDFGTYKLYTTRNVNLDVPAGSETDMYSDSIKLDLGGWGTTGTGSTAIVTYYSTGSRKHTGSVHIVNAADVSLGGIDTHANSGSTWYRYANAGSIGIGEPTGTGDGPVGNVRVDSLSSYTSALGYSSTVSIYSSGNVYIEDSTGTVRGDIRTTNNQTDAGDATVLHNGSFRANDILLWTLNSHTGSGDAGDLVANGNADGVGDPTGTFEANNIETYYNRYGYCAHVGSIDISNYTGVTVNGDLDASNTATSHTRRYSGDILITNIAGDINVLGEITADSRYDGGEIYDGRLELQTTGTGTINLASLDCATFRVATNPTFDSANGVVTLSGDVLHFDMATGNEIKSANTVTYDPFRAGNAYLGFGTYGLDGGGVLTPSATSHVWKGDDPGAVWDADQFDDATTNLPTAARRIASFEDGATSTAVAVQTGSGAGPTVGTIRFAGNSAYSINAAGGTITMDSGDPADPATIVNTSTTADSTIAAPIALNSNLNVDVKDASRKVTLSGVISGAKSVTKAGPGTAVVLGSSSYDAGTTVGQGTLLVGADVGAAGTHSPVGTGALTLNGGALGADGTRVVSRDVTLSADSKVGGTGNVDLTISGNLTGAHSLSMDGDGVVTLSGSNAHGDTVVETGTLKLGSSAALGNGNATVNGGRLDVNASVVADTLAVSGGVCNVNAASSANTVDVTGGTLNLNAVDLTAGTMTVSGGTVNAGNSVLISDSLKLDCGTYSISAGDTFKAGGAITQDGAQKIILMGGTLTAITVPPPPANPAAHYSFDDSGNPGNDDSGNGHLGALSGGAAYTAGGKLDGGLSTLGGNSMMQVNPVVDIGASWTVGAWFNILAGTAAWRTLTRGAGGDHQIIIQSGGWTLGMYDNDGSGFRPTNTNYNMSVHNDGGWHSLIAVGTGGDAGQTDFYIDGTWVGQSDEASDKDIFCIGNYQGGGQRFANVIDEVYVYTRELTADEISALYQSGSGAGGGPAVFNTLAGTGTVVGTLSVTGGLEPGASIGTLAVDGDLTLSAGATYEWELGDGVSDLITASGNLTLEDGWVLKLLDAGVGAADGDFLLFTYTGAATVGSVVFDPASDWGTAGLGILDDGVGNVYVTGLRVAPVPEPAGLSLLGLALLGLRRKRRSSDSRARARARGRDHV